MSNTDAGLGERVRDGLRRRWRRLQVNLAGRAGCYEHWRDIDWLRVERLVFVCSGNICRSPFAEKIAVTRGVNAISCGTTAKGGAPADPTAVAVARRFDIDLVDHLSIRLADVEFTTSDLVLVMDLHHLATVQKLVTENVAQLTLLGLWDHRHPVVIADPFGCSPEYFDACFLRIVACMDKILIKRNA